MSFIRVTWWPSSTSTILFTLVSALAYWAFMASRSFFFFWKKPNMPLFSSWPKCWSSPTRPARDWPISPRSLVRTELRVFSEKEAMFFWAAAPY